MTGIRLHAMTWLLTIASAGAAWATAPAAAPATASSLATPAPASAPMMPAPTTAPASAPRAASIPAAAPALDFSSPTATVKTFYTALNKADFAAVRQCLEIPADHAADADALLAAMKATSQVQQAAAAQYPIAGAKVFGNPTPAQLAAQLKAADKAQVAIDGSAATFTLPADDANRVPGGMVQLKQIDGAWKIDGTAFFKLNSEPAEKTAARVALARKIAAISDDIAKEIPTGKYFSATEAYQEYWTRCRDAAAALQPSSASGPASAPRATQP